MARQADPASIYVAKRMCQDIHFLVNQGILESSAAATIQYPILPLLRNNEVTLQSVQWHTSHVVEPVVAVRRGAGATPAGGASPAPVTAARPGAAAPTEELARALYDFETSAYDELPFKQGDWLVITERTSKDWYRGRVQGQGDGKERLFPANYVEVLPPAPASNLSNPAYYTAGSSAQPYQVPGTVPPGGADAQNGDKWKKAAGSRVGQAAIGGLAFGAGAGLASSIF